MFMNNEELDDEQLALLDVLLSVYGTERENGKHILSLSELDGFFAALISSPEMMMPSQWIPVIFDQQEQENITDEDMLNVFMSLLFNHYNDVSSRLRNDSFHAFFDEGTDDFVILDEWCSGYIFGAEVAGWGKLPSEIQIYYDFIRKYAVFTGDDVDINDEPTPEETQQRAAKVEQAVMAIYRYFSKLGKQPIRKAAKTGVNDPCPCGSGKKFKKCCLN